MSQNENLRDAARPESQNLAIGVLSITAVILLVGVLVVSAVNDRAMAIGQTDRGGDYILVTSQFNNNTEFVIVTDAATQQMLIYGWNMGAKQLDVFSSVDLKKLSAAAAPNRNDRNDRRNRRP